MYNFNYKYMKKNREPNPLLRLGRKKNHCNDAVGNILLFVGARAYSRNSVCASETGVFRGKRYVDKSSVTGVRKGIWQRFLL